MRFPPQLRIRAPGPHRDGEEFLSCPDRKDHGKNFFFRHCKRPVSSAIQPTRPKSAVARDTTGRRPTRRLLTGAEGPGKATGNVETEAMLRAMEGEQQP